MERMTDIATAKLVASLEHPRFEVIPAKGVEEQIAHLPAGATVTITSSPGKGLDATLDLAARLAAEGFAVVPHIAARLVAGVGHLEAVLRRFDELRLRDMFVVAGDAAQPAGPFEGAAALLAEMARLGHGLDDVGITGYPESHAFISDETTIQTMFDKAPYATYIVSQICYDPAVTAAWVGAVRDRGVDLPIHIGIPGVVDRARLARISFKVGLGDSARFLRKQGGVVTKLLAGYTPDDLVERLGPMVADETQRISGWHLFTFNEVERTERWRRQLLDRLAS